MKEVLIDQFRVRVFEENYTRIERCLAMLTEAQVWWSPNIETNSIANLILHLEGNARQWIITGLGGGEDHRRRSEEFSAMRTISKSGLLGLLDRLKEDLEPVLEGLSEADLVEIRPVQTYEESGVSILVHVIEHFSYHTGQIALLTKIMKESPLGFYDETVL